MRELLRKIRRILRNRRTRRLLMRIISSCAAVVVFVTTYALILPAITLEKTAACGIEEHQHTDDCYEEVLTCGQDESGDHVHDASCYEKVLVCGREVHTHSTACYIEDDEAAAAVAAGTASTASAGASSVGASEADAEEAASDSREASGTDAGVTGASGEAAGEDAGVTEASGTAGAGSSAEALRDASAGNTDADSRSDGASGEGLSASGSTAGDSRTGGAEGTADAQANSTLTGGVNTGGNLSSAADGSYVPALDDLAFSHILNANTGIYYHRVGDGETVEDSTALADWTKLDADTKLGENDLLRAYLAYTIPAGSLNATNPTARYRLPANLRLTDSQIEAINANVNGIAAQYVSYDSLEITDPAAYSAALGIEAVEGTRRPGEDAQAYLAKHGGEEYISATVRAENIYSEKTGDYEGTDLVFTFVPYTIEKNQHTYDASGDPTSAGQKVSGWLTLDFNTSQVDWEAETADEPADDSVTTRSARILFVEKDKENGIDEISAELHLAAKEDAEEKEEDEAASAEDAKADNSKSAATADVEKEAGAEAADAKADTNTKAEDTADAGNDPDAQHYPAVTFDDSIRVLAGTLSTDTDSEPLTGKTRLTVHVEAEEGTFPEGTTMALGKVDDMDAVAEAVKGALDAKTRGFHAVDISFHNADGDEIEPRKPIKVSITSDAIRQAVEDDSTAPVVMHIEDAAQAKDAADQTKSGDSIASTETTSAAIIPTVQDVTAEEKADEKAEVTDTITFEADAFSVYAIVYTVDFEYTVNGQMYRFSLPGGEKITLSDLIKVLGIIGDTYSGEKAAFNSVEDLLKEVANVEFSDESLVKVTKNEDDNDWTLESLQAFDTEETLTISMKNGDEVTVKVTDARKPVLSNTYGRIKIVKEWYDAEGNRIEAPTLDDTYTSDFILTGYEYTPSDIVRLHFVDSEGNEDSSKTVIVPTGRLRLTLYNTPEAAGTGYLFSEVPSQDKPIINPYNNINLLTDVAIQSESAELNDGNTINYWVMDIDLNDYANELTDVYLGIAPSGSSSGISYFTNGTYPDRTVDVSTTTKAMNIAYIDASRWAGDTYRNRHIWDMIKGTNNEYTLQNQDLELTSSGGSGTSDVGSFFGYTIVENAASANGANNFTTTISWNNGVDTVYSNGLTGWSPELYITSPNTNTTVVVKNQMRADVDVPVEKHWDYMDQYDDQYDWEAKFVLQWAPLYEGEGTPKTEFVEVEPRQYITITESMMDNFGNSFDERSFKGLPLYGEDENGPFRYEYSVEEESYMIKSHTTGEVLATYDRHGAEGEKYTGTLPHFVPFYPHDAGELSANTSDYMVMVVNGQEYSEDSPTINITVNKLWEDEEIMEDDTHDYKAYVKLQRYDQQSTRTVQDYDPETMVEIKIYDQNGKYVKSEFVEKGVQQRIHITWNSYGYESSKFSFTSTPNLVSFSDLGHSNSYGAVLDSYTEWFYPVDGMEIHVINNNWNAYPGTDPAVNVQTGLELLDEQTSSSAAPDTAYNSDLDNTFTLSLLENRWSTILTGLPLTEVTTDGDTQTIHHYSYYFVEDPAQTTPSGYTSRYLRYDTVNTDHEIELGDNQYRIDYDGEHVTIKNMKDTLRIRKEWRGVAKSDWELYPDSVFDLYGTNTMNGINNATDGHLIKSGLHLNKANDWEWMPEDEADFTLPQYNYYYVVERTDQMGANAELGTPAWDSSKYEVWMYYNENGTGNNQQPWKAATNSSGTITILNALHSSEYLQLDLKKKWMEWGTPTSWDTTTGVYKRLHDLVMGFVVYRRVWDVPVQTNSQYPSDHIISPGPMGWSDYGNEILVGYDSNGHRVLDDGGNTFELINGDGGNWHWTIKNQDDHNNTSSDQIGLTSEGWYTKPNGEVVWAYYEYTVRETGIWKNLKKDPVDDPEISWFSNSVPMAAWYKGSSQHRVDEFNRDIGQDQDRLMNGQAFDMWVEKDWVGGAWDAREVYVKIYRKLQQGGTLEDFTEELARDLSIGGLIGYLGDGYDNMIDINNKWIVFTPGNSRLYIDKVLKTHPNASGTNPYDYWIVEVGYKDKHGQVHMYSGSGTDQSSVNENDLLKLTPVYSAGNGNVWTTGRVSQSNSNNGIVLGEKGTNHLKVTNTPVRDFAVIKKWQNAIGEEIDAPVNQLQISIKQIRTARIQGETVTKEANIIFDGSSDKLTLTNANTDNRVVLVAQDYPDQNGSGQRYKATVSTDANVGSWALYVSGLEERYIDENGVEWICTYQINEDPSLAIPSDYVTDVTCDGIIDRDNRNITIKNTKMEGGMLKVIKQIAEGSDNNTEDPFTITVTLTPPHKGNEHSNAFEEVFGYENGLNDSEKANKVKEYIDVDEEETILIGEPIVSVEKHTNVVTITMTLAGRGTFTIRDIKEGTTYEVRETSAPGWKQVGDVSYSNANKTIVKQQLDTATITNEQSTEVTGDLIITKTVASGGDTAKDFTFSIVFSGDNASVMAGQTYVATRGTGAAENVTLDSNSKATVTLKHGETITISGLPLGVTYTVTEAADDDYTAAYASTTGTVSRSDVTGNISATPSDVTVTNTPVVKANLDIIKVDKESRTPITTADAKFVLYKIDESVMPTISTDTATKQEVTVDDEGTAHFTELRDGYYQISETKTPRGYVLTTDGSVYIHVDNGSVSLVEYVAGENDDPGFWSERSDDAYFAYNDGTLTIGNEPGAELPHTGGPGTRLFTILGSILILGAGVLLWRRRRLI